VGSCSVQRIERSVDVEDEVDASIRQGGHARIVVSGVIDGVHTNGVDAQLFELGDVTGASTSISDRVNELGAAARLIVDTTDVETLVTLEEGCYELEMVGKARDEGTDHCPWL